jgi:hypothetical protein
MDSLSFWMYIENPDNSANLKIESKSVSNNTTQLGTISGDQLSANEWNLFAFKIGMEESSQLVFTPTLPTDGSTRLWMDDLSITAIIPDPIVVDTTNTDTTSINYNTINKLSLYPNPATGQITITGLKAAVYNLNICNLAGQTVFENRNITANEAIDVNRLTKGIYLMHIESSEGTFVLKFVKN